MVNGGGWWGFVVGRLPRWSFGTFFLIATSFQIRETRRKITEIYIYEKNVYLEILSKGGSYDKTIRKIKSSPVSHGVYLNLSGRSLAILWTLKSIDDCKFDKISYSSLMMNILSKVTSVKPARPWFRCQN